MLNTAYRNSFSEIIDILKHMKKEDVQKVSPEFIEYLRSNASKTYVSTLDHSKTIKEMNLNPRTKAILALIYNKYWSNTDEVDKNSEEDENVYEEYQKELSSKESTSLNSSVKTKDFSEQTVPEEKLEDNKNLKMMTYKESFFEKILNKIKTFFKREKNIN